MNQKPTRPKRKYTPKPQTLVDTGRWRISPEARRKLAEMEQEDVKNLPAFICGRPPLSRTEARKLAIIAKEARNGQ